MAAVTGAGAAGAAASADAAAPAGAAASAGAVAPAGGATSAGAAAPVRGAGGGALPPFEAVVETHGPAVLRFCLARGGADAGEDAFQETMIAALRAYPELRDAGAVRGWLFSIAHRKTIDLARAAGRTPRPAGDPAELEQLAAASSGAGRADTSSGVLSPADVSGSGPASAPRTEPTAGLDDPWGYVRALPPKQREAVTLRYLADLTAAEVAAVMGTTPEAARRNVFEGLRRLRSLIQEAGA